VNGRVTVQDTNSNSKSIDLPLDTNIAANLEAAIALIALVDLEALVDLNPLAAVGLTE